MHICLFLHADTPHHQWPYNHTYSGTKSKMDDCLSSCLMCAHVRLASTELAGGVPQRNSEYVLCKLQNYKNAQNCVGFLKNVLVPF